VTLVEFELETVLEAVRRPSVRFSTIKGGTIYYLFRYIRTNCDDLETLDCWKGRAEVAAAGQITCRYTCVKITNVLSLSTLDIAHIQLAPIQVKETTDGRLSHLPRAGLWNDTAVIR
jgi:hypothetical protein